MILSKEIKTLGYVTFCERFIFHSIRSMLILYCLQCLKFPESKSYHIFTTFMALSYTAPIFGGFLADKVLGFSKSFVIGSIFLLLGSLSLLFFPNQINISLAVFILGSALLKSNITSLFGILGENSKENLFSYYFKMINIGALCSPIMCAMIGELFGWQYCFIILIFSSFICIYMSTQIYFKYNKDNKEQNKYRLYEIFLPLLSLLPIYVLLSNFINFHIIVYSIICLLTLGTTYYVWKNLNEVKNIIVIIILFLFNTIFWAIFEQSGSTINVFTSQFINRELNLSFLGTNFLDKIEIPTTLFQSVNSLFVIILIPILNFFWNLLQKKKINISEYTKFGFGLIIAGISYLFFMDILNKETETNLIELHWLFIFYFFLTLGEIFVAPIGLSLISKLAPPKIRSVSMGVWQFSTAFSNWIVGIMAMKLTSNQQFNNFDQFNQVFSGTLTLGVTAGFLMILIFKFLNLKKVHIHKSIYDVTN